jgi:integrase
MREGIATDNPVIFTNRPGKAKARERVLSFAEIAAIWDATHSGSDFDKLVRLLVLTGQRRGEVAGMAWSEINFDAATWSIPSERTKNGRSHVVPLSTTALSILAAVINREERKCVFGHGETGFDGWSRRKARLDAASGVAGWTLHDLRRSYATHLSEMGVAPHVLEALLNHVSGSKAGVAGVYNRAIYAAEKRAAMVLWAEHITAITGGSATVTPLRGRSV